MKTLAEEMLPANFLLQQGIYIQTCSHIELAIWHIMMIAENFDYRDQASFNRFLHLKLNTWPLIKSFKVAARRCPPHVAIRIHLLAREIQEGLLSRNAVAHGAWHLDRATDQLRVEHYFKFGNNKPPDYRHLVEPISEREVRSSVEAADRLLREAVQIRELIETFKLNTGELKTSFVGKTL